MAETEFSVVYDGPAVASGRIPVRDLAPSLFALAEVFRDANEVVNPTGPEVRLEIQATEEGSFEVQLFLLHALEELHSFFSEDATGLNNLIGVVGGTFGFIGWLNRRTIIERVRLPEGRDRITTADGDSIEIPSASADIYDEPRVRAAARDVVLPLDREGIDSMRLRRDSQDVVVVESGDVDSFDLTGEMSHGPGNDPYMVREVGTDDDQRTSYLDELK